jgi:hypothetical protein
VHVDVDADSVVGDPEAGPSGEVAQELAPALVAPFTGSSNLHVPFSRWYLSPFGFRYDCKRKW